MLQDGRSPRPVLTPLLAATSDPHPFGSQARPRRYHPAMPMVLEPSTRAHRRRLRAQWLVWQRFRRAALACGIIAALLAGCASPSPSLPPAPSPAPTFTPGATISPFAGPSQTVADLPTPRASSVPASASPSATAPSLTPGPPATPVTIDPRVLATLARLDSDTALAGQLLMLGWHGTTADSVVPTLTTLRPGGIVFIGSNADTAAEALAISARIVAEAGQLGLPGPFISIDQEGGRIQRIDDVPNLGSNMAFGKTDPTDQQACRRGAEQADELRSMGFSMNLAPDVDVLTNPKNTVIGDRAYGPDPELVARLGAAYTLGLQGSGVAGVAKHFPGHGSTSVDSHLGLPVVPYGLARLDRVELVPFVRVTRPDVSVAAVMVGHLSMTKLDPSGTPASLSGPVVQGLLRDHVGFHGLVMTDDLGEMAAITSNYTPAEAAVMAISAGVDMLVISGDVAHQLAYRDAIVQGLASGTLSRVRVLDAVKHVLEAKARFGLLGGPGAPSQPC